MSINDVFEITERQKIWEEIDRKSKEYREQTIMEFGYAQGIVSMLKIIEECSEMTGKDIHRLYLNELSDSDIDEMVKRLIVNNK